MSRHDNHNLEIKTSLQSTDGHLLNKVDFYIFMPKAMQLSSCPKSSLMNDFSCRVRLSSSDEISLNGQERIEEELATFQTLLARRGATEGEAERKRLEAEIFAHARHLGAVANERLKNAASTHSQEILLAHSLFNPAEECAPDLRKVAGKIREISAIVQSFRTAIDGVDAMGLSVLDLLDRFLHHLLVEYIAAIRKQLDAMKTASARFESTDYEESAQELEAALADLQRSEARRLTLFGPASDDADSSELWLYRQSQLKKFFQAEMFVEISKQDSSRKLAEPAAILGATVSALLALGLERAAKHGWLSFGLQSMSVAFVGIFLYVFKDRMKDRGKNYFFKKMGRFFPDFEQDLFLNKKKLGQVKEHYSIKGKSGVPSAVRTLRELNAVTEAERHTGEDVFCYSRVLDLPHAGVHGGAGKLVKEVMRLNLVRYLKHMDDVYKEVPTLTPEGDLSTVKLHKVYYFYVVLSHSVLARARRGLLRKAATDNEILQETLVYRLIMDKKGIQRIDSLTSEPEVHHGKLVKEDLHPLTVAPPAGRRHEDSQSPVGLPL